MRFRVAQPQAVVDLRRVPDLSGLRERDDHLWVGAMTRQAEVEKSDVTRSRYPLLADAARVIADPVVRNLATVGGNVAHADPGNDLPAVMLAYRATMCTVGYPDRPADALSGDGPRSLPLAPEEREIEADDFFTGPFETALGEGEILTGIRIPAPDAGSGGAYAKLERKVGDYAVAAVAVQLRIEGGKVAEAGVALTNVGLTVIRAADAEKALIGSDGGEEALDAAGAAAAEAAEPTADARGSEAYKRAVVRTLTFRAASKAIARARGGAA